MTDTRSNAVPTLAERLAAAAQALEPVSETPRLDAEYLLAHALGCTRSQLLARLSERADIPAFDALLERRKNFEPVPYILGTWEFYSIELAVRAPMLVPRPETEHLVESVLDFVKDRPCRILELGAGTGCISIAIAHSAPSCQVIATDINRAALELAAENAARHNLTNRIAFRHGDLFDALQRVDAPFDVVCSNPPYVEAASWDSLSPSITRYEDPRALLAGDDGLDVIRRIIESAPHHLVPGGLLALEIGMGQHEAVAKMLRHRGFVETRFVKDLASIPRIALATLDQPQ